MLLSQLRELIEHGRTALLRFKPINSVHYTNELRIQKYEDWYAHQLKIFLLLDTSGEKTRQISEHSDIFAEWREVEDQVRHQRISPDDVGGWTVTDDVIDPFPPEHLPRPRKEDRLAKE